MCGPGFASLCFKAALASLAAVLPWCLCHSRDKSPLIHVLNPNGPTRLSTGTDNMGPASMTCCPTGHLCFSYSIQAPQAVEKARLAKDTASRPLFLPDPARVQVGPEQDRDHLYHPSDRAEVEPEPQFHRARMVLSAEVENGPSEDRDHLYHS
uniref:Uncharacterized protein n=1 Tax=Coturnix japonica TaxID=93934 RepID=A0A8C2YC76_COTJA